MNFCKVAAVQIMLSRRARERDWDERWRIFHRRKINRGGDSVRGETDRRMDICFLCAASKSQKQLQETIQNNSNF